jgi:hypothetical protein
VYIDGLQAFDEFVPRIPPRLAVVLVALFALFIHLSSLDPALRRRTSGLQRYRPSSTCTLPRLNGWGLTAGASVLDRWS